MKHRVPGPLDLPRHGFPASGAHPRNAAGRSLGLAVGTSGGKYHGPGVGRIDATWMTHCGWIGAPARNPAPWMPWMVETC